MSERTWSGGETAAILGVIWLAGLLAYPYVATAWAWIEHMHQIAAQIARECSCS